MSFTSQTRIKERTCSRALYKQSNMMSFFFVGSVVEWLKYRADIQHGLGSKPIHAILLRSWCSVPKNCPHYVYSQSPKKIF